jgi:phosphoribosylformylglycinamidine cyclo-ligase
VGIDLVAMSVNDILVQGAEPLFFLDYFACGRLDVGIAARVIAGIASGCEQSGCALIGGETAEMPDMYPDGEYDLAGFAVGVVERQSIIDGSTIRAGDALIGLASSGAHSNGYSLIRRVLERAYGSIEPDHLKHDFHGRPFSEVLLAPTRLYGRPVLDLIRQMPVKGLAHITGGGLIENVPRMLPEGLAARIGRDRWPMPPLFAWLQREGGIDDHELFRVFNCGIGMVIAVDAAHADEAVARLERSGEQVWRIGEVVARPPQGPATLIV